MIVDERYQAAEELFNEVCERYPDVELVGIGPSPETDNLTVVSVILPGDDEREEAFAEFAAERATEILLETGVYIIVVSGLYEVWIEFHAARSRARQEYLGISAAIEELIQTQEAGQMGSISFGNLSSPSLTCRLRDLDFARNEIASLLENLGVLDEVKIFWEHPYHASGRHSDRTRLYPPEADG
ncbi:MAG: hypothetical protein ABJF88_10395 [Rhodothermales bacterium]